MFFYINDDQQLTALRVDNWKTLFLEQRAPGTMLIWVNPFTNLRIPKMFNLRTDPYERADVTSNTYYAIASSTMPSSWSLRGCDVGRFLMTFKDYPQRQKAATFNMDEVLAKLKEAGGDEAPLAPSLRKIAANRVLRSAAATTGVGILASITFKDFGKSSIMLVLDMGRAALKPVLIGAAFIGALALSTVASQAADPLPSWNDGPAKQSIIRFCHKGHDGGFAGLRAARRAHRHVRQRRHALERTPSVQLYFVLDRVKALAPQHPEWNTKQPFASLLKGDLHRRAR